MGKAVRDEREKAWAALSANALLLPGAGSIYLGRRVSGSAQVILALLGFAISMVWMGQLARQAMAEGVASLLPPPQLGTGLLGFGLFGAGWVWGLATAWAALRRADAAAPGPR